MWNMLKPTQNALLPPGIICPTSCTVNTDNFSSVSTLITPKLRQFMDNTAFPGGGPPSSEGLEDRKFS